MLSYPLRQIFLLPCRNSKLFNSLSHFPPLGLYSGAQEPPDQPLKLIYPYRMKSALLPSISPLLLMHFDLCVAVSSSLNESVSQIHLGYIFYSSVAWLTVLCH